MIKVEDGLKTLKRYYCIICGYDAITEDEVWCHIDEEHTKEEIIDFCIDRTEFEVDRNIQMRF